MVFICLLLRVDLRTGLRVLLPVEHFLRGFTGTAAMALFFCEPRVTTLAQGNRAEL